MQFLIPLLYLPIFIDPDECVLDLFAISRRLVDTDVDGESVFAGRGSETQDEGASACGLGEGYSLGGGWGNVVGCFREEEGLYGVTC